MSGWHVCSMMTLGGIRMLKEGGLKGRYQGTKSTRQLTNWGRMGIFVWLGRNQSGDSSMGGVGRWNKGSFFHYCRFAVSISAFGFWGIDLITVQIGNVMTSSFHSSSYTKFTSGPLSLCPFLSFPIPLGSNPVRLWKVDGLVDRARHKTVKIEKEKQLIEKISASVNQMTSWLSLA